MQVLRNKRVTVAGLGRFGGQIAAARWLVQQGAQVLVTDKAPAAQLAESIEQLAGLPIEFRLGEHREADFTTCDLVVASPAVAPSNVFLRAARAAGIPVTTEIRLFVERCPATIVGVTGSKGKSTTTALLGLMLGRRFTTWVGGNIGRPLLLELDKIDKTHVVVLELSSFMLEYLGEMKWSPHLGVVTMVVADHLDWHGSEPGYVAAKKNIVRFQRPDDFAVLNEDDPASQAFAAETTAQIRWFGLKNRPPFDLSIPGAHNQVNAQAAFAAAALLGVERGEAQELIRPFRGLPHRLQLVHESQGVRYFNDSIATIPQAAVAALESFAPHTVIHILGGKDKGLALTALCNAVVDRAKAALCIGETGAAIAGMMAKSPHANAAAVYECGDLATAVRMSRTIARPGDVVLLSTGCASYDQFDNFEKRGEAFTALARESKD